MNWTDPTFATIADLLAARAGLQFNDAARPSTEAAIRRAMRHANLADVSAYARLIGRDPELLSALLAEVTVGETYFFREPAQFRFVQESVLPGAPCPFRAWSAGCSTGEEAYSLAMLFESVGMADARVLGTDISQPALSRARDGVYRPWSLRGQGTALCEPFLTRKGELFRVQDSIRRRVDFACLNLAEDCYPSLATGTWGLDLIFCRNVLIYLDPATIQAIAVRLFAALRPGGWLLTASSDPPLQGLAAFATRVIEERIYYQKPTSEMPIAEAPPVRLPALEQVEAPVEASKTPPRPPIVAHSPPELAGQIRARANVDLAGAERACGEALRQRPLSAELHYLHALLLLAAGYDSRAIAALRRVLFIDRSLAVAHFTLGTMLERRGDTEGARRAYRKARDLAADWPGGEPLPLGDGEQAPDLLAAAVARLAGLDASEVRP
jgi:chemotaxis protein methyltransferase CheR